MFPNTIGYWFWLENMLWKYPKTFFLLVYNVSLHILINCVGWINRCKSRGCQTQGFRGFQSTEATQRTLSIALSYWQYNSIILCTDLGILIVTSFNYECFARSTAITLSGLILQLFFFYWCRRRRRFLHTQSIVYSCS